MKVTRLGFGEETIQFGNLLGGGAAVGPSGQTPTSDGSNGVAWASNVGTFWANGSNQLIGPAINVAAGSNVILTLDQGPGGSMPSNTVRIHAQVTGGGGGGGAPTAADYLVGTAHADLSNEIVVGTSPGGELGGTWASPTVDTTHSGSSHAGVVSTHEAAADPHTGYVLESLFDAKGDILAASADNTPAKVTVGANDTILMADSAQTAGVKWVASGAPAAVGTANSEGTTDGYSRTDHVHAHEAAHVAHDTIWAAKGDLVVATANDTATVRSIGTDRQVLTADSANADGVKWAAPLQAGTATAGTWPTLATGTIQTTPDAGSIERDANVFYLTTDAGNRGAVVAEHIIRLDANYTLTSSTSEQKLFNSPANGRLSLETGTYFFDAMLSVQSMSATSGNAAIDWLGAGTATVTHWLWHAWGQDQSNANAGATSGSFAQAQQGVASVVTAGVGTILWLTATGTFKVTGAGTLIPSITLVTAAAAVVQAGSHFRCRRQGSTSLVSVGQWD